MRFIASNRPPLDGEQVDVTWRYLDVRGGPDRRYRYNRMLPVARYGQMLLGSSGGLRWIVDRSRPGATEAVAGLSAAPGAGGGRAASR